MIKSFTFLPVITVVSAASFFIEVTCAFVAARLLIFKLAVFNLFSTTFLSSDLFFKSSKEMTLPLLLSELINEPLSVSLAVICALFSGVELFAVVTCSIILSAVILLFITLDSSNCSLFSAVFFSEFVPIFSFSSSCSSNFAIFCTSSSFCFSDFVFSFTSSSSCSSDFVFSFTSSSFWTSDFAFSSISSLLFLFIFLSEELVSSCFAETS